MLETIIEKIKIKNKRGKKQNMKKIVITGGPCAGKDCLKEKIVEVLGKDENIKIFFVDEAATSLILGGIVPNTEISMDDFQTFVLKHQLFKEHLCEMAAKHYEDKNIKCVMFCNRGILDQLAYTSKEVMRNLLSYENMTLEDALHRYDCVIHLTSAANGAEEFYTLINDVNGEKIQVRTETIEQARILDENTKNSWLEHENLKVVENKKEQTFEEKLNLALDHILKELEK